MLHGLPWIIPLVSNSEVSRRFLPSLRRDLLLTDDQIRRIENFSTERPVHNREQPVYAFGQPFRLRVSGRNAVEWEKSRTRKGFWIFGVLDGEDRLECTSLRRNPLTKWGYQQPG